MSAKIGGDAKLYRNTDVHATPNWSEMGNVRDNTLNLDKAKADLTTRANQGWRANKGTLKELSIETEIAWDTEDGHFDALLDSYMNGTALDLVALDGSVETVGSLGVRFQGEVMSFSRNEPLEEGMTASVTIEPTYAPDHPPELFEVT